MSIFWTFVSLGHALLSASILYSPSLSTFLDPVVKSCPSSPDYSPLGIPGIDFILCILTPFFKATISTNFGILCYLWVVSIFIAAFIYVSVESLRPGSSYLVKYPFIVFIIGQAVGICVAFPMLYLTSHFIKNTKFERVSADRVFVVGFCAWVLVVASTLVPFGATEFFYLWHNVFQLIPLVGILIPLSFSFLPPESDGVDTVTKLYEFFTVLLSFVHLYMIYLGMNGDFIAWLKGITPSDPDSCSLFLLIDGTSLFLSLVILILARDGAGTVIKFLGMSVCLGPGAAFLVVNGWREKKLAEVKKDKVE